jgi:hypothetical protein
MAMTDKQRKSLDRHIDRVLARRGDGDKELSLYIRVCESRIYEGKSLHKAVLTQIIFMRMTDLHEGDTRIPKGTPWSNDYRKNEGWAYMSQKYLANRVGSKDPTYINKVLKQIENDGFIKSRSYPIPGRGSQRRKQYFPLEANINAKIIELGLVEDIDESDDNSVGGRAHGLNPTADRVIPIRPHGSDPTAHLGFTPFPHGLNPKKVASEEALEEDDLGRLLSPPPNGVAEEPSLRSEEQQPKATSTPQEARSVVVDGLKPETKPTSKPSSGLAVYLDDEPEETTGGEPTPVTSSASRRVRQLPVRFTLSPLRGRAGNAMKPAEPRTVPCLFCTKNSRRNPDSDYCTQCWDEWKRTGIRPVQPPPSVPTPIQQACGKAPAAESGRSV